MGTFESPWRSLHHAIHHINNNNSTVSASESDPYVIHVFHGIYSMDRNEAIGSLSTASDAPLPITQGHVVIAGAGPDKTVLDGTGASGWTRGFNLEGSSITLYGLEIRNFAEHGIDIYGDNNVVENCRIHHNGGHGIYVDSHAAGNTIHRKCEILFNAHNGIHIDGAGGNTVSGVIIGNNGGASGGSPGAGAGIKIIGSNASANRLYDTEIRSKGWPQTTGIWIENSGAEQVYENRVFGHSHCSEKGAAIRVIGADPDIKKNMLYENMTGIAILASGTSAAPVIENNLIYAPATGILDSAISIEVDSGATVNPVIFHNTLDRFSQAGIRVTDDGTAAGELDLRFNIISGPAILIENGSGSIGINSVQNCFWGYDAGQQFSAYSPAETDLLTNPQFVSVQENNYYLSKDSPCRDAISNPQVTEDLKSRPRPLPAAKAADIGALEYDAEDEDNDGMSDTWEQNNLESISASDGQGDADGDGLTDLAEFEQNTLPYSSDSDGDGYTDGEEIEKGTDPNDASLTPSYEPGHYFVGWYSGTGLGTPEAPWQSLSHAIHHINAGTVPASDDQRYFIHVMADEYTLSESLVITQPNVTIIGAGFDKPVLDGGGAGFSGVRIDSVAGVVIENLEFRGFASAVEIGNTHATVTRNRFSDNDWAIVGTMLNPGTQSSTIIKNNLVLIDSTSLGGINVTLDDGFAGIYHNTIDTSDGSQVSGTTGVKLDNNANSSYPEIFYNIIANLEVGISYFGAEPPGVEYNDLAGLGTTYKENGSTVTLSTNTNITDLPSYGPDKRLLAGTAAVDYIPIGDTSDPVKRDIDGMVRPDSSFDIGCYESPVLSWVGGATAAPNSWHEPYNWQPAQIPGKWDTVVADQDVILEIIEDFAAVWNLFLNDTLSLSGSPQLNAELVVGNKAVVDNDGVLEMIDSKVSVGRYLLNKGSIESVGGTNTMDAWLVSDYNAANALVVTDSDLHLKWGYLGPNNGDITLNPEGVNASLTLGSRRLFNQGTMNMSVGAGTSKLNSALENESHFDIKGSAEIGWLLNKENGSIGISGDAATADLITEGRLINLGSIYVSASTNTARLSVRDAMSENGGIYNQGSLNTSAMTETAPATISAILLNQGSFFASGITKLSSSSICDHVNGGIIGVSSYESSSVLTITDSGSGTDLINSGMASLSSGGELLLDNGNFINTPSGQIYGSGTLSLPSGLCNNSGQIMPDGSGETAGVPGTLVLNGDLEQTAPGAILLDLGGTSYHDSIDISGEASMAGLLSVSLMDGYSLSEGDAFSVIKYGSTAGEFASTSFPPLPDGQVWDSFYQADFLELKVAPDSDGDGVSDNFDGCVTDPNKTEPGQCGCGTADTDSDGDGTADCNDGCPSDPNKTEPGACGCGTADTDADGNGVADCNEAGTFTVTFSAGDGGTLDGAVSQTIEAGGNATAVSAQPADGYAFTGWSGDHTGTENPLTVTGVAMNMTISAQFNQVSEKPTLVAPVQGGIVDSPPGASTVRVNLSADTYSDPENDAHVQTCWKYGKFGNPLMETSCSSTHLNELPVELETGMKYQWQAGFKDAGSNRVSWSDTETFILGQTQVDKDVPPVAAGDSIAGYRMVSFVQWPDNPSAEAVFAPLMEQAYDRNYRIGTYDPTLDGVGGYREYPGFEVRPGRAYWFLARQGMSFEVEGVYVSTGTDVNIGLLYNTQSVNGWNQVAPPNNAGYLWGDIEVIEFDESGAIVNGPVAVKDLSGDNDYIDIAVWYWQDGAYTSTTSHAHRLKPYRGYWVRARRPNVYLNFSPNVQATWRNPEVLIAGWAGRGTQWLRDSFSGNAAFADGDAAPPMPMGDLDGGRDLGADSGCFVDTVEKPVYGDFAGSGTALMAIFGVGLFLRFTSRRPAGFHKAPR
ncbi:MAG: right-handed parallel beta-helix repeat-containing protein [Thermodesulfobacteriota bacterium]